MGALPPAAAPDPPTNTVTYNGVKYGTLDNASPSDSSTGTQSGTIALPAGWAVAPEDSASIAVVAAHAWGSDFLVLAGGDGYFTPLGADAATNHPPGSQYASPSQDGSAGQVGAPASAVPASKGAPASTGGDWQMLKPSD